jgi:hypothetical protein
MSAWRWCAAIPSTHPAIRPSSARPTPGSVAEVRAAARIALHQVLQIYADPMPVNSSALDDMAGKIDALKLNERGH